MVLRVPVQGFLPLPKGTRRDTLHEAALGRYRGGVSDVSPRKRFRETKRVFHGEAEGPLSRPAADGAVSSPPFPIPPEMSAAGACYACCACVRCEIGVDRPGLRSYKFFALRWRGAVRWSITIHGIVPTFVAQCPECPENALILCGNRTVPGCLCEDDCLRSIPATGNMA